MKFTKKIHDPVRRTAYKQAMKKMKGRPLGLGLTEEQRQTAIAAELAYPGYVYCGDLKRFPLKRR